MKTFTNKLLAFLLFVGICIPHNSCNLNGNCGKALCDLTTSVVLTTTTALVVGASFDVSGTIFNVLNTVAMCSENIQQTEVAGPSDTNYLMSQKSASGNYDVEVLNENYGYPSVQPGASVPGVVNMTITEPGDYQIITFADHGEVVPEREEENNTSTPLNVGGKMENVLRFTVHPNPNYVKKAGEPIVIVNSFKIGKPQ